MKPPLSLPTPVTSKSWLVTKAVICSLFLLLVLVVLFYWVNVVENWENLISGLGIFIFILLFFVTSHR